MVIPDTDHMSLMQRGEREGTQIRLRLQRLPLDDLATTVVTHEEQMRGWLGRPARASGIERQIADCGEIKNLLQDHCSIAVLDFDAGAAAEFKKLQSAKKCDSAHSQHDSLWQDNRASC